MTDTELFAQEAKIQKALAWADDWRKCEFLSINNGAVLAEAYRSELKRRGVLPGGKG